MDIRIHRATSMLHISPITDNQRFRLAAARASAASSNSTVTAQRSRAVAASARAHDDAAARPSAGAENFADALVVPASFAAFAAA